MRDCSLKWAAVNTSMHTINTVSSHLSGPGRFANADQKTNERMARGVVWLIVAVLAVNQYMMITLAPKASAAHRSVLSSIFGVKAASAAVIIGPKLNADGKTTSLMEQPTISEVPANPKTGDALADAKVVILAKGKPAYAPDDISFDDPINAQNKWGAYEQSIQLSGAELDRYNTLIDMFTCNYCCGDAAGVTRNKQCGCAHAKAARGYFRYMVQTYGAKYSDEQLMGEGFRWQAIWYPRGAVADYLLATGNLDALPHQTHGGAGADGMHGLTK